MLSLSRYARAALLTATATAVAVVGAANPASAADGTVNTAGGPLNVRSTASTSGTVVATVADGSSVDISCQKTGSTVTGTYGTSNLWDYLPAEGGYVADVYVNTGSDGRVAPNCVSPMTTSSQCTPSGCAGKVQYTQGNHVMSVLDLTGDGHSAVALYWLADGTGPYQLRDAKGSGTSTSKTLSLAANTWVFYKACLGEYGTKTVITGTCSAGVTDYA